MFMFCCSAKKQDSSIKSSDSARKARANTQGKDSWRNEAKSGVVLVISKTNTSKSFPRTSHLLGIL